MPPFDYTLPLFARYQELPIKVLCESAEKAIMLTRAAMMQDKQNFEKIVKSKNSMRCRRLGMKVKSPSGEFDEDLWMKHIEDVAFEVTKQKFISCEALMLELFDTGDAILAEATPDDALWGVGLQLMDPRVQDAALWHGRNILGAALMKVRDYLQSGGAARPLSWFQNASKARSTGQCNESPPPTGQGVKQGVQ